MSSKVDAVVDFVKKRGRSTMMTHIRTMNENQKDQIQIFGNNSFSFSIDESVDMNQVFSIDEMIEGIKQYDEEIGCDDAKYDALIAIFQPLILSTQWFQEYQNSKYFGHSLFDFFNGKYTDQNIQGMFEIFIKTLEMKDKPKGNDDLIF
nr:hypothetical protein [uncultured Acinetobacter sp.]